MTNMVSNIQQGATSSKNYGEHSYMEAAIFNNFKLKANVAGMVKMEEAKNKPYMTIAGGDYNSSGLLMLLAKKNHTYAI